MVDNSGARYAIAVDRRYLAVLITEKVSISLKIDLVVSYMDIPNVGYGMAIDARGETLVIKTTSFVRSENSKFFQAAYKDLIICSYFYRTHLGLIGERVAVPVFAIIFQQSLVVGEI